VQALNLSLEAVRQLDAENALRRKAHLPTPMGSFVPTLYRQPSMTAPPLSTARTGSDAEPFADNERG